MINSRLALFHRVYTGNVGVMPVFQTKTNGANKHSVSKLNLFVTIIKIVPQNEPRRVHNNTKHNIGGALQTMSRCSEEFLFIQIT